MEDLNSKFSGREATRPGQKPKSAQARGGLKPRPRRAAVITSLFSGPNLLSFLLLALMGLLDCAAWGGSIGTAFTYQGRLQDGTNAASGLYDLRFAVYDAASAGNQVGPALTNSAVVLSNGLFTVTLDFGANVFDGNARWLETAVRTNGVGAFGLLPPRQPLTPAPYALYAPNAGMAGGVANGGVTSAALAPGAVTLDKVGAGQIIKSLNGLVDDVALAPGTNVTFTTRANTIIISAAGGGTNIVINTNGPGSSWGLTGNAGTTPGVNFLGTTDNQPLEFRVNGFRALRLEPTVNDADHSNIVNVVGGSPANYIAPGVYGSVIVGGGAVSYYGLFGTNTVFADASFLGGGLGNSIQTGADYSFLGGGSGNSLQTRATYSFLGGGYYNTIQTNANSSCLSSGVRNSIQIAAYSSFLGSGQRNSIQPRASCSFLGGGTGNSIQTDAFCSFLGGGELNINGAPDSVVPGGAFNCAGGRYSFAAGFHAKALYQGDFVWADSQDADFAATASDQFLIRAAGGVGIGAPPQDAMLDVQGNIRLNDHDLFLRQDSDRNHGLGWYGGTKTFAGQSPDGPVVYGHGGGLLGTTLGGNHNWTLQWTPDGNVNVRGTVNATAFNPTSDRNAKANFSSVDASEILERVSALPITRWNFKEDEHTPHIGPMAQDFHAAFGLGTDDKHIATVDADGVALAAIQALNQKLEAQQQQLRAKDVRIQALEQRLEKLELLLTKATEH